MTHQSVGVVIPADMPFSDLKLARDPDGEVSFDFGVIARIEQASGLPEGRLLDQGEDLISGLITQWYRSHRADGGAPDAVMEDIIGEARLEDEHGAGFSHRPGSA